MELLRKVTRLVRNHLFLKEPNTSHRQSGFVHSLLFFLNIFPPYNILCLLWIRLCIRLSPRTKVPINASRAMIRNGFLYGALRHIGPEERSSLADLIASPASSNSGKGTDRIHSLVSELSTKGFSPLGQLVDPQGVQAAVEYFSRQSGFVSQVPGQSDGVMRPFNLDPLKSTERYFCFPPSVSWNCAQLAAIVDDPLLRDTAAAYLGFVPELYGLNTFATFKGEGVHYVMKMHRDRDSFRFLAFFLYWTDVAANDGATLYVPGSHKSSRVDERAVTALDGKAGHCFAIDPFGLHAGNSSVSAYRIVTWIRFGQIPNLASTQDGWLPTSVRSLLPA